MATPKHVLELIDLAYKEKADFLDLGGTGINRSAKGNR